MQSQTPIDYSALWVETNPEAILTVPEALAAVALGGAVTLGAYWFLWRGDDV